MKYIGTCGYYYYKWVGEFYPSSIMKYHYFDYYANRFNSLELNSTFYRFPKLQTMRSWKYKLKNYPGFRLSLKANRIITHKYRLSNGDHVKEFLKNVKVLEENLGVILFQLPPGLKYDISLLENFIRYLDPDFKYAFEFRDKSWQRTETFALLEIKNISFAANDFTGDFYYKRCSDFDYVRLHGTGGKYKGSYNDSFFKELKNILQEDAFIYFNNTDDNSAFKDAERLKEILK